MAKKDIEPTRDWRADFKTKYGVDASGLPIGATNSLSALSAEVNLLSGGVDVLSGLRGTWVFDYPLEGSEIIDSDYIVVENEELSNIPADQHGLISWVINFLGKN